MSERAACIAKAGSTEKLGRDIQSFFKNICHSYTNRSKESSKYYIAPYKKINENGFAVNGPRILNELSPWP